MRKTRAQVLTKPYHYEFSEILVLEISDDEVLIKIKYYGVCGSDWGSYTGKYTDKVTCLPLITGHEFYGTIKELGANAQGLKAGGRVTCDTYKPCGTCYHCRIEGPLLCTDFKQIGVHVDGGFAEYVKVPWKNVYRVPDEVSDEKTAFVEPLTACLNASRKMDYVMGRSVVIIGAGLGIIRACMTKLRGTTPMIVIDSNPDRLEMAEGIVVNYVINFKETPDVVGEAMKLANGVSAGFMLEAVRDSRTYEQAFQIIGRGRKVETFSICADDDYAKLPLVQFVLKKKRVSGNCAGIGYDQDDALTLLKYNHTDPAPLISMIIPLEELEDTVSEIRKDPKLVKVLVSPEIKERVILYQ